MQRVIKQQQGRIMKIIPLVTILVIGLWSLSGCASYKEQLRSENILNSYYRRFMKQYGPEWKIQWNDITKTARRISAGAILLEGPINEKNIEKITRNFISENEYLFGNLQLELSLSKLDYDSSLKDKSGDKNKEGIWYIAYKQKYRDVVVESAYINLVIKNAHIVTINANLYPNVKTDVRHAMSVTKAALIVNKDLVRQYSLFPKRSEYVVLPVIKGKKIDYRPAWKIVMPAIKDLSVKMLKEDVLRKEKSVTIEEPRKQWIYYVDAHSGEIISRYDSMEYENDLSGDVQGSVYETTPDVPHVLRPIAHGDITVNQAGIPVQTMTTDILGHYASSGVLNGQANIEAHLTGPHAVVHNNETADPDANHSAGPFALPAEHNWDWTVDDPSPQDVETNAFFHVNLIHDWFLSGGPFDVEPQPHPMEVTVRDGEYCNASAGGDGLYFGGGKAGSCLDFALGCDIIYHEYTHRIVGKVYSDAAVPLPYSGFSGALNEGWADYFGGSITNDPRHGDVIYSGRNIDTGEYHGVLPPDDNRKFPRDWNNEVHWDGLIFSGALWDTRKVLGVGLTDDLTMLAMKQTPVTFSDFLEAFLISDDNDANLNNGTPNINTICQSFYDSHGVFNQACASYTNIPVAEITSPSPIQFNLFDSSVNSIDIVGTAYGSAGHPLSNFIVEFADINSPDNWLNAGIVLTGNGTGVVINNTLAVWDINAISDGKYNVKLSVTDDAGQTSAATTTLVIDRLLKTGWPQELAIHFNASAVAADIDQSTPELEIVASGTNGKLYVWHSDGSSVAGWPKYVGNTSGSPAIGDLDCDGDIEIVVASTYGSIRAFHHDGTTMKGWPILPPEGQVRDFRATPALGDIDNDGDLEVIIGCVDNEMFIWHHNGQPVQGWPQAVPDAIYSSVALGDLDNDGFLEIVAGSNDSNVYAWNHDGTSLAGWPQAASNAVGASAALGDIDNDGDLEVIIGSKDKKVYAWNHDGTPLAGWPKDTAQPTLYPSSQLISDVDNDNALEAVALSNDDMLHVWENDGTPVNGWPPAIGPGLINAYEIRVSSPVAGDIDGDNNIDLVCEGSKEIYAFKSDGTIASNWPRFLSTYSNSSPAIADIDNDGNVEVIIGSNGVFIWDLPAVYHKDKMDWPLYRHDISRTGLYGFTPPVTIYVDTVNGNDAFDGLSRIVLAGNKGPKKTINAGIAAVPAGGICSVAAGVYTENVVIKDGIVLSGAGPGVSIIDGGGSGNAVRIGSHEVASTNAVIKGFTIRNGGDYGDNSGIRVQNSPASLIYNNLIVDNGADAIRVYGGSPRIFNNTITKNGRNGVMTHNAATPVLKNNIIISTTLNWPVYALHGWGIYASSGAVVDAAYNNVWDNNNNYGNSEGGVSLPGANSISADPLFINAAAGDYRLTAGSPCRNVGAQIGLPYSGTNPDLGAFEYAE